jgi:hypothetical protein
MTEIWKDIVGYEGLYQVSNLGRVKSLTRNDKLGRIHNGRILTLSTNKHGYSQVSLCNCGRVAKFEVHRLVALAFLDNPYNLSDVNHRDGVRSNNCVVNLEWCSRGYNINYSVDVFHKHSRNTPVVVISDGEVVTFGSMRKAELYMGLPFHTLKRKERGIWFTVNNLQVRVG